MSLKMQYHPERGKIRILFDEEGRRELLHDIESAINECDHSFGLMDADEAPDEAWQQVEFYNIICLADRNANLRVDNSITISGGGAALAALCDRIKALPPDVCSFELQITDVYQPPRKKKNFAPWLLGAVCSGLFLLQAGNRLFVFAFNGNDAIGLQMWCYLITAIAVLFMPWLISLRTRTSAGINTGFGVTSLVALALLTLGFFKNPCHHALLSVPLHYTFLCGSIGIILTATVLPVLQRRTGSATRSEQRAMKWLDKLVLRFLCAFALFALLCLATLVYVIRFCYSGIEHWYDYPFNLPLLAAFVLPVGLLAGFLRRGFWQRACYWVLTCTLLPGLIMAVPCYFLGTPVLGIDDMWSRIFISLLPLVPALCLFPYLRRKIRK